MSGVVSIFIGWSSLVWWSNTDQHFLLVTTAQHQPRRETQEYEERERSQVCFPDKKSGWYSRWWIQVEEVRPKNCQEQSIPQVPTYILVCFFFFLIIWLVHNKYWKHSCVCRSYYKCTEKGCRVKKQVQRLSGDEEVVVTTYQGVHTHPVDKPSDNFHHILTQMHIVPPF